VMVPIPFSLLPIYLLGCVFVISRYLCASNNFVGGLLSETSLLSIYQLVCILFKTR
jgi:hypothetical protein